MSGVIVMVCREDHQTEGEWDGSDGVQGGPSEGE